MARKLASGRRLRAALVSGGLLAGVVAVGVAGPAHGMAVPVTSGFSAYANGTALHAHVLQLPPRVADVDHAFASVRVSASGLADQVANEVNELVNPKLPDSNAYARGGGAEVGLGSDTPVDPSGKPLLLPTIAEAKAPGAADKGFTDGLVSTNVIDLNGQVDPLANATALQGRAAALWNPHWLFPTLGNPLTYGFGTAADAQVLDTGTATPPTDALGRFIGSLLATNTPGPDRSVISSQAYSYLVNNGDGTCGIAEEIHQELAPVRIDQQGDGDPTNDLVIEVGGDWIVKGVLTGKAAGSYVTYGPDPKTNADNNPLIRITDLSQPPDKQITDILRLGDITGDGIDLPADPLLHLTVGEPLRAIAAPGSDPSKVFGSKPTLPADNGGTAFSAAADVVRLQALVGASPPFEGLDLRLGHFEMKANIPSGGVNCEIPVSKTGGPATVGTPVNFTVKVPTSPEDLVPFPCDISNVSLTDKLSVQDGNPVMYLTKMVSAKDPAHEVVSFPLSSKTTSGTLATTDSWANKSPSLTYTVTAQAVSGAGHIINDATAKASASNCKGSNSVLGSVIGLINGNSFVGADGKLVGGDFFGVGGSGLTANLNGGGAVNIQGTGEVRGVEVARSHVLAVTGRNDTMYLAIALAALASAFGAIRLRRRLLAD